MCALERSNCTEEPAPPASAAAVLARARSSPTFPWSQAQAAAATSCWLPLSPERSCSSTSTERWSGAAAPRSPPYLPRSQRSNHRCLQQQQPDLSPLPLIRFPFRRAIQKGSFLGADTGIEIGVKTQSFSQGCCSGEGFFILKAGGSGRLLVNSYGAIMRYDLAPGETRIFDTGFLVCWTDNMDYKVRGERERASPLRKQLLVKIPLPSLDVCCRSLTALRGSSRIPSLHLMSAVVLWSLFRVLVYPRTLSLPFLCRSRGRPRAGGARSCPGRALSTSSPAPEPSLSKPAASRPSRRPSSRTSPPAAVATAAAAMAAIRDPFPCALPSPNQPLLRGPLLSSRLLSSPPWAAATTLMNPQFNDESLHLLPAPAVI